MNMESATFLVCEKSLNTEALFIPATGFLCDRHITDQIQRLLIPPDFSVVVFRPDFMLVSEEYPMKMPKNQWLASLPSSLLSLEKPCTKARSMVPEVQMPS